MNCFLEQSDIFLLVVFYILNRQELLKIVPDLREHITVGLYAKTAALVSPYLFTIALCEEGIINGGELYLEEDLVECRKEKDIFDLYGINEEIDSNQINEANAIETNSISVDEYFTTSRLERDAMYSQRIENYQDILNNGNQHN